MIYVGPLFSVEREKEILNNSNSGIPNATNMFQMDLLQGFIDNNVDFKIINVLPIGTYPKHYNELVLKNRKWSLFEHYCYEVGSLNIPVLKQWQRAIKVKQLLTEIIEDNEDILVYSAYLPFLKAIKRVSKNHQIILILTDLPEYYDLGKTSYIKKMMRKINNRYVYKYMKRIDKYVFLTDKMAERFKNYNKPYVVVEGIWNEKRKNSNPSFDKKMGKHVIFYAGTLHKKFGIINLLEAFHTIKDSDIELWVCGKGDSEDAVIKYSNLDGRIKYFGYLSLDDVNKLQEKATILVNPRPNEGTYTKFSFPSKTMGYLASGKPLIAYKLEGIPEEYDDYINYVNGNSIDDLARTIKAVLYDNNDNFILKARKAAEFINKEKSPTKQALKVISLIKEEGM